ncbi:MAG: molecular chaperone TorD family protein [Candidatus Rokubacteria bacterium]|nr:molecular chaperone TorD family protein [Candidatus Rokubacteria bacterium]
MIGDRELLEFRRGYYDLFVSLLWKEPAGALLTGLAEGMDGRMEGARNLHPLLGEGWGEIARILDGADRTRLPEMVGDEYTRLFIGPPEPEVNLYESYYLAGRLFDRPLAGLRAFLGAIGLEKEAGYAEPEDFLAFELEIMRRLIARQASASDPDEETRGITLQAAFLKQHLLVWAPSAAKDLLEAKGAHFYRGVARLLQGFLELERDLFNGWGPTQIASLDEARRTLAQAGTWRGPLFDPSAEVSQDQADSKV